MSFMGDSLKRDLTDTQVTAPDFLVPYTEACRAAAPMVQFICKALKLAGREASLDDLQCGPGRGVGWVGRAFSAAES